MNITRPKNLAWRLPIARLVISVIILFTCIASQAVQAAPLSASADTLVVGLSANPIQSLDPSTLIDVDGYLVDTQIMDTLITYNAQSAGLLPGLATNWSVSSDGLTWTFTLRSGVKFQDGTNFDADAVLFNFTRWWDPTNPFHDAPRFEYFESYFFYKDNPDTRIASMETSGSTQFVIHLKQPYNILPYILSNTSFSIASPTAIQAGTIGSHPVGTGAYQFQEWDLLNNTISLTASANYWGLQPFIPNIKFVSFNTPEEQVTAIKANLLHVAYNIPGAYYETARQDVNIHTTWRLDSNIGYLGINRGHGPLADLRVRQAIAHAIDTQNLVKNYSYTFDALANQFLPPEIWGYDSSITGYDYNPDLARSLLAQAGYPDGFNINLEYRNVVRLYLRNPSGVAQAIKNDLANVGIQVNVLEKESGDFISRVQNGDVDLFLLGWAADFPHPDNFFTPIFCDMFDKAFGPRDDAFCADLTAAMAELDPDSQLSQYKAASMHIHNTLPMVPIVQGHSMILIRSEVAGLEKASFTPEFFRSVFWANGPNEIFQPNKNTTLEVSGTQVINTTVNVPAGALAEPVVLSYALVDPSAQQSPVQAASGLYSAGTSASSEMFTPPGRLFPAGPLFELSGYTQNGQPLSVNFLKPVELIFSNDKFVHRMAPTSLTLYVWENNQWQAATSTCPAGAVPYLDPVTFAYTVPVCKTGTFGLFGDYPYHYALPLVN